MKVDGQMNNFNSQKDQLLSTAAQRDLNNGAPAEAASRAPVDVPVAPEWTDHEYPMPPEEQALVIRYYPNGRFAASRPTGEGDGSRMLGGDSVIKGGEFVRFGLDEPWWFSPDYAEHDPRPVVERKVFSPALIVVYYQFEFLKAKAAKQTAYVTEDEPTADLIRSWGLCATCVPLDRWQPEHFLPFEGVDIVLVRADGIWRETLARKLVPIVRRLRVLEKLPEKISSAEELTRLTEAVLDYDCRRAFSLKLSNWRDVVTHRHGPRKKCFGSATPAFKTAWETHNKAMRNLGYDYTEFRGKWEVTLWRRPEEIRTPNIGPKPTAGVPDFDNVPKELAGRPIWLLWRYEPPRHPGQKWRKVPYQPPAAREDGDAETQHSLVRARANDPATWSPLATVRAAYEQGGFDGIGFVFDGVPGPDGLVLAGGDFDHCIGPDGKADPAVQERVESFGTYWELSPSGGGIHMLGYAKPLKRGVNHDGVEMYTKGRYFTFTGQGEGTLKAIPEEFAALAEEVRAKQTAAEKEKRENDAKDPRFTSQWFNFLPPEQQDTCLDYALGIVAAKTKMLELRDNGGDNLAWFRIATSVARSGAPHGEEIFVKHASGAEDADDEVELGKMFTRCRDSAMPEQEGITVGTLLHVAMDNGGDFGSWRLQGEQARRGKQIEENIKIGDDVTESLLPEVMTLEDMHRRLVFIGSSSGVADRVTGRVRKKEHAADEYAASKHTYTVEEGEEDEKEGEGEKKPKKRKKQKKTKTAPALPFWIASPSRMSVEVLTWFPGQPQICQPPEGQGPAFNTWMGLNSITYPDDWQTRVQPFLDHVEYLVPVAEERERFLCWLAHMVQVPEVLPHTSYLMTTPTTGIGRNLLASILVRALRGFVAAGMSLPELLDGQGFNGRVSKKVLIIIDEAREGGGERRYQRGTTLTRMQTEEHRHIKPKYGHESVEKNCARWLSLSNYEDAIPFDPADRRVIVILNPTVRQPDAYYERLYGLLGDIAFIGSVRRYLETKDISAFRPGEHAPMTAAKLRVLDSMMSGTDRAVAEFKEDCTTELTSRDAIKAHVTGKDIHAAVNDTHLTYAIGRARMLNTGKRIVAYKKNGSQMRVTVVIVRPQNGVWTRELVEKANSEKLLEAMGLTAQGWSSVKPTKPSVKTGFLAASELNDKFQAILSNSPLPQGDNPETNDAIAEEAADKEPVAPAKGKLEQAKKLLADMLTAGPFRVSEVEAKAAERGISHETLKRARKQMGVRAEKKGKVRWLSLQAHQ
jgi:primase-polymerase (primpol)-like protein